MHNNSDLVITKWGAQMLGFKFPCSIGRAGIGRKDHEGDGITPSGIWKIDFIMTRPDRVKKFNNTSIHIRDTWSDDPNDPKYNHLSKANKLYSYENLWRSDPLYNLIAVTNFNRQFTEPGLGSAIFLHTWRRPRYPTEGCVAFSFQNLEWILSNWDLKSRIIIKN
jgi:L,D-peptidoglycan transpeptidase YkuD (ErfK/YbiS/YcfS/YnhG family)